MFKKSFAIKVSFNEAEIIEVNQIKLKKWKWDKGRIKKEKLI